MYCAETPLNSELIHCTAYSELFLEIEETLGILQGHEVLLVTNYDITPPFWLKPPTNCATALLLYRSFSVPLQSAKFTLSLPPLKTNVQEIYCIICKPEIFLPCSRQSYYEF